MIIFSVGIIILGIISAFFGYTQNNDAAAVLKHIYNNGRLDGSGKPGTVWIVLGAVTIVIGIIMFFTAYISGERQEAKQREAEKWSSEQEQEKIRFQCEQKPKPTESKTGSGS